MLHNKLKALGFEPLKDFILDAGTGTPVISQWLSSLPQPTEEELAAEDGLVSLKEEANARITRARNKSLKELKVSFGAWEFDADEDSAIRMTNVLSMLTHFEGDPRIPAVIQWLDSSNTPRNLTAAQLKELAATVWLAQQQVWGINAARKDAIKQASDQASIDAVTW